MARAVLCGLELRNSRRSAAGSNVLNGREHGDWPSNVGACSACSMQTRPVPVHARATMNGRTQWSQLVQPAGPPTSPSNSGDLEPQPQVEQGEFRIAGSLCKVV